MYQYPADEALTDILETRADPHKRLREAALIEAMAAFPWRRALDFGCGHGRNIALLRHARSPDLSQTLLAVDADPERLAKARQNTAALSDPKFIIDFLAGGADALHRLADGSLELILCCQVLTHMATGAADGALACFARLLKPGGVLIVCVPFHNVTASEDFFHEVDLSSPDSDTRRISVSRKAFDALTTTPTANRLPVRAFRIDTDLGPSSNAALPFPASSPLYFRKLEAFFSVGSLIYSVHDYRAGKAAIGDLIFKLIRIV